MRYFLIAAIFLFFNNTAFGQYGSDKNIFTKSIKYWGTYNDSQIISKLSEINDSLYRYGAISYFPHLSSFKLVLLKDTLHSKLYENSIVFKEFVIISRINSAERSLNETFTMGDYLCKKTNNFENIKYPYQIKLYLSANLKTIRESHKDKYYKLLNYY